MAYGKITDSVLKSIASEKNTFGNLCLRTAPLIDVIFLLLIFFFITAKFQKAEAGLSLQLPAVENRNAASIVEPLVIEISKMEDGIKLQTDDKIVSVADDKKAEGLAGFIDVLATVMKAQGRTIKDPVILCFDDEVSWQYVSTIYNLFFAADFNDITFKVSTAK